MVPPLFFLNLELALVREGLERIAEKVAADNGYEVYESNFLLKGENSRIVIRIDHPDGVTLEDCENFTREYSAAVDSENLLPNYSLEVSSPGLDRELRNRADYIRFIESPVKCVVETDGERTGIKGVLKRVEDDEVVIEENRKEKRIAIDAIVRTHLDY